jgi:Uma2 family endonuclease
MSSDPAGAGFDSDLPDIDDRLVEPETRYEMLDGELVYVSPADDPHARRQAQLCALIEAHIGLAFRVASDLLTRTSKVDDFAPDVSVYLKARHPETGKRQLAQLVFEVVSTQTLANAARKAGKLAARGVRRVFAIDIERSRALEWSATLGTWSVLDSSGHIVDPALEVPLSIEMIVREARTDDAVARALIARRNPEFEAASATTRAEGRADGLAKGRAEGLAKGRAEGRAKGRAEGRAKGRAEGLAKGRAEGRAKGRAEGLAEGRAAGWAEAILGVLVARGMSPDREARERIVAERDPARLQRWLERVGTCRSVAELFVEPEAH